MFFEAALSLKPNDVDALFNKAVCLSYIPGRHDECKRILEEVISIDQNHTEARKRLGLMESESHPEKALQTLPKPSPSEDSETKLYRAIILIQLRRYTDALSVLAKLNAPSFENHFEARLARARAFRGNREFEPAYAHATKAIEIQPNSENALMLRASIALEYQEWQKRNGNDVSQHRPNAALARLVASIAYPTAPTSTATTSKLGQSVVATRARESSSSSTSTHDLGQSTMPTRQKTSSTSSHYHAYGMPSENTAASSRSNLASSHSPSTAQSRMPPMNVLLSNSLDDLNRALILRPDSIQALSRRATVFHLLGQLVSACDDFVKVLNSPMLQAAERASVVLKLGRVLFELGDEQSLKRAHDEYQKQLYYALDLEVLTADVRVLMAIGSPEQLVNEERIINACMVSMTDRGAVNAMPSRNRGPLLLLLAKLNKRISELKKLRQFQVTELDSHTLVRSLPARDESTSLDSSEYPGDQDGEVELHRCEQYAEQAVLQIEDVRALMREASFWRQSGESDLAIKFARQAVLLASNPISPSSSTSSFSNPMTTGHSYGSNSDRSLLIHAKLCLAKELFARGKEAEVLDALFGLSDDDAQVALYRVLAQHSDDKEKRLNALDSYLSQLTSANSPFGTLPMEVKIRTWTTAQFHRACVLWKLQDRHQARFAFEEVLQSFPNHPSALIYMAELLMVEGELSTAINFFKRRLEGAFEKSLRIHLLMRIAHCHHMLGEYIQCLDVLDNVLFLSPKHQEAKALKEDASRLNTTLGSAMAYTRETVSGVTSYLKKLVWNSSSSQSSPKQSMNTSTNLQ
jgi:tetratricopeptide (TPR) repeat protein